MDKNANFKLLDKIRNYIYLFILFIEKTPSIFFFLNELKTKSLISLLIIDF